MVDPLLIAVGGVAEGLATELALQLVERQRRRKARTEGSLSAGRVRRILQGSADQVAETLEDEIQGLPSHEWEAAVTAARDTLRAVSPIVVSDALASDLCAARLEAFMRRATADIRRAAVLSEQAEAVYDRVLAATCQQIVESVVALPGFSVHLQVAAFQDVRELRRTIDRLADGSSRDGGEGGGPAGPKALPAADPAKVFERRYLAHVEASLGQLELFGVSRGRVPRAESFDTAYVSVAVARSGHRPTGEDDDELTGAGVDVRSGLAGHRRVLLRGGAGAGKTTLLRWLAVHAARAARASESGGGGGGASAGAGARRDDSGERGDWTTEIPFFVPLREVARTGFPAPEALPQAVAQVIAAEMPAGWVSAQFRAGRALLLVDGLDELEPARRLEARQWLEQLVAAYGDARFVVSARPFAVSEDWLSGEGFVTFDLLPLSPKGVRTFLAAWHGAAREEHADDPAMQAWLDECEAGLASQFAARHELRRLAGSPLLCGLLCALYQDRNMHLPRDRKGLFDAALDLLLVRWDEERGVLLDEWPPLSKEEQIVLLQRFAYSMVKNHEVVVARDDARSRIAHAMRGLRSQDVGAEPVLQRTLERTGLLREPGPGGVQFVHRTFRDYLAAKEVVDSGELAFLVEQAHLDHWHDVVVNAVAHARPLERDEVLRRLVEGNSAARAEDGGSGGGSGGGRDGGRWGGGRGRGRSVLIGPPVPIGDAGRIRSRLQLVAAACLEQADVLDSDEVRALVQEAAARLIPPATLDEADILARAGKFVLDLLPGPEGLSADEAACVVRTAAMIGGEGVADRLAPFVSVGASRVIDELLRAWRRSEDPEAYARAVLADVDFGSRRLEVRGWHRVRCLAHLRRVTNVACYGDFVDLSPVAAAPSLARLELVQNEMVRDLSALVAARQLRELVLTTGFQFLRDLSPLVSTDVSALGLHLLTAADLSSLAGTGVRRLSIRDLRLNRGLDPLPDDLPLEELVLDNLPRSRDLAGIERWPTLTRLTIRGIPRSDEHAALAELPALDSLTIRSPEASAVEELASLVQGLSALRRLRLVDAPRSVDWAAALRRDDGSGPEIELT